jgi:prophage tail gpP-like protein
MTDLALVVNGRRYGGWKSVRVTRSIESLAGSFALDVSDRWAEMDEPWAIIEEDPCRVEIDGQVVIDGYIDKRSISASAASRTLSYSGRDRAAALVDCSAILDQWTFRDVVVSEFVAKVAAPFGVRVSVQPGLVLPKVSKIVLTPGDSAFEAIKRAVGEQGVLFVSDGAGGILITRAGTDRAQSLVEGVNILSASVEYDGADRFHHYIVSTQAPGTDEASGDATRVGDGGIDEGVRRTNRALVIRPDKGCSVADARKRADWEARIRAARAEKVSVTVLGWKQSGGPLWPLNTLTRVKAPQLIGVDGDMRISQIEHSISESGQVTQLSLVRPDAFTPEPKAAVKSTSSGGGAWKELRKGASSDPALATAGAIAATASLNASIQKLKGG